MATSFAISHSAISAVMALKLLTSVNPSVFPSARAFVVRANSTRCRTPSAFSNGSPACRLQLE